MRDREGTRDRPVLTAVGVFATALVVVASGFWIVLLDFACGGGLVLFGGESDEGVCDGARESVAMVVLPTAAIAATVGGTLATRRTGRGGWLYFGLATAAVVAAAAYVLLEQASD